MKENTWQYVICAAILFALAIVTAKLIKGDKYEKAYIVDTVRIAVDSSKRVAIKEQADSIGKVADSAFSRVNEPISDSERARVKRRILVDLRKGITGQRGKVGEDYDSAQKLANRP